MMEQATRTLLDFGGIKNMFYLTKRVSENQCTVGERCITLCDWATVPVGHKGTVAEIYKDGIMIAWDTLPGDPPWRKKLQDGFSSEDLQYLAFCTLHHPKVDPEVYRIPLNQI